MDDVLRLVTERYLTRVNQTAPDTCDAILTQ
jgi:hypothetical protein